METEPKGLTAHHALRYYVTDLHVFNLVTMIATTTATKATRVIMDIIGNTTARVALGLKVSSEHDL